MKKKSSASRGRVIEAFALPVLWVVVIAIFGILRPATFLSISNFSNVFSSQAVLLVVALALMVPLIAGDYDLSVGAIAALSAMTVAILNVNHHVPILTAVIIAVLIGAAIGAVNGAIVVLLDLNSFIVTLGTGTIVAGAVAMISQEETITGVSNSLVRWTFSTHFLGVALEFYFALALAFVLWWVTELTPVGQRLLFVGQSRETAKLSGVRVRRLRWSALVISGFISALAGVMFVGTLASAGPIDGSSEFLLPAFAAAFLGATCIRPGRFNSLGVVIAVYFLSTGIDGLQLLGVQSYVQSMFYGGVLVAAVAVSEITHRRRLAKAGSSVTFVADGEDLVT